MSESIGRPVVAEIAQVVATCDSVARACNTVVSMLHARTGYPVEALLASADHLTVVAASGRWHAPKAVPVNYGVVGRVLATGRALAIGDASIGYSGLHEGQRVGSVVCAPITSRAQSAVGVINVESDQQLADLDPWISELAEIGQLLGERISELGGPPAETRAELLLRHTLAFADIDDPMQLAEVACRAAAEISGLRCAALLARRRTNLAEWQGRPLLVSATYTAPGSTDLIERLVRLDHAQLSEMIDVACRHGASRTLGDPGGLDARGLEPLVRAGVRTLITTRVQRTAADRLFDAALLVMDELAIRPHTSTVSVVELLMTNAAACYQRIITMRRLQELADSDPLTGLRHLRPFSRRLKTGTPARTALLVIDIDAFKHINDTLGHAAGDQALVEVAGALRQALRAGDEVFRVGGDEFVAVLDVPDEAEAMQVAERLAAAAADVGRAISVGVALRRPDEAAEAALRRADQAMYAAKQDPHTRVRLM